MIPPREIRQHPFRHIGRTVRVYDEVPSTNDLAGAPGEAAVADRQTHGRGQYGRRWLGEPGQSLLLSVCVQPPAEFARPVILTAWAAVAAAEAVLELTQIQTRIKWPNDLLLRGRKVCGILIEQKQHTVAGLGLNLNQTDGDFASSGLPEAGSLLQAAGQPIPRDRALECVLKHLDEEYDRLLTEGPAGLEADWKWRIGLLGREVIAVLHDGTTAAGRLREMTFHEVLLNDQSLLPERIRQLKPATS